IVRALGSRAAVAVPLVARNRRLGVITLHAAPGQRPYDAADVALVQDLARRAALFLDNARLEADLRQSQKLEAIGRLAGGVAHDFNNLLTVVLSFADLLKAELPAGSRALEWLDQIRGAGERAASLTRQLLAFGRSQVLTPSVLDLNEVVRSLEKMLRRVVGEHIEFELALGQSVGNIRADITQLEQVIVNLVANARDAMPEGGKLTIETADATLDEPLGASAKPYVRLSVRDTGVGMDRETRERIFEPFFTTKGVGHGAGLGLATVLGIVTKSEGRMAVRSEPGHGSTFDVYLPREPSPASPVSLAEPTHNGDYPPERQATVLLVEHDPSVLKALCAALADGGFGVLSATRGEEALGVAARHEGPIDLLLSDVMMPGIQGPELARRLRVSSPGTRVLFLSGHARELPESARDLDASYLAKPVARDALLRAVRSALNQPPRPEE
ncbi:MAG: response regulator, partial [Polyangiaceae bacterium]|nr:response regulator [Polyangiaceae bacterium]